MKKTAKRGQIVPPRRTFEIHRYWVFALVLVIVLCSAGIRLRLLQMPLERDEGEYAYAGQLILHGIPPYLEAYNMKLPGVYVSYALIMAVFGQTIAGIHIGLILVNSGCIVLLFFLAKRLFDSVAGLVACASFAVLSMSPSVLGMAAHATHFVVLPTLGGLLLLLKNSESRRPLIVFSSGLLFGLAFVMKQPGVFFIVFGMLYLVWANVRMRPIAWRKVLVETGYFSLGAAIPFGLTCLILFAVGVFSRFWFWTFSYAGQYVSETPVSRAPAEFWEAVKGAASPCVWLWAVAGVGLISVWWIKTWRVNAIFVAGLFVFSFLAVCPGFYFRQHYFIPVLPVIAILAGAAVSSARHFLEQKCFPPVLQLWMPVALFLLALCHSVIQQERFFFDLSPQDACRALYGSGFPESIEIARYVKTNSAPTDRIAVFGSEPQIYFYAGRRSATGYIYAYSLMEEQKYALKMQRQMIAEIEAARPTYIIYAKGSSSWLRRPKSERMIFDWFAQYLKGYEQVGFADLLSNEQTVYRFGDEATSYSPRSANYIAVYKRKASG